jgi:hypothetical protein
MKSIFLIITIVLIGAPFLISEANALLIDTKRLCLSEAIRDNGTNITAVARTFDQCMQKMQMLDNIQGIRGGGGNPNGASPVPPRNETNALCGTLNSTACIIHSDPWFNLTKTPLIHTSSSISCHFSLQCFICTNLVTNITGNPQPNDLTNATEKCDSFQYN